MKNRLIKIILHLWPKKIRDQLIVGITLTYLFLMLALVIDIAKRQQKFLQDDNYANAIDLLNDLSAASSASIITHDYDRLERILKARNNFPNLKYAMILSDDNVVLAHSDRKFIGLKPVDEVSLGLKNENRTQILVKNSQVIDIAAPVLNNKAIVGWVRVGLNQQYIQGNLSDIIRSGISYVVIAFIVGVILAIIIASRLSKGLYELVDVADNIAKGNLRTRAKTTYATQELASLGNTFNQMLEELVAKDNMLESVLYNMPIGVWTLDATGQIKSVNPSAIEIWGGTKIVGIDNYGDYKAWYTNTGEQLRAADWGAARAVLKGERTINEELLIETFDGKKKYVLHSSLPLYDMSNVIQGALVINVDITDRKKAELQLQKINLEVKERVKELRTLYKISEFTNDSVSPIDEVLQSCIAIIPASYRYADIAHARLLYRDKVYSSDEFEPTVWKQESALKVFGQNVGQLEVYYSELKPILDEGPFVAEERLLLDSVADMLGGFIEKRSSEEETIRLNRLYQFISVLNESMLKCQSEDEVYKETVRISVEIGGGRMSWIGFYDESNDTIVPYCWYGHNDNYLQALKLSAQNVPYGQGPTGKAIRNRTHYYCNDIETDPDMAPWKDEAMKRGYRSSVCLPIIVNNTLKALFTIYMSEVDFFNESELRMLKKLVNNIEFALDKIHIRNLQVRSVAELKESETKFRSLVEQTMIAVYIIQEGKLVYVNQGFTRGIGFSQQDILNSESFLQFVHPDDREKMFSTYIQKIKGDAYMGQYSFRVINAEGKILFVEATLSRIVYNNAPAVLGAILDITDRIEEENRINKAVLEAQENERIQMGMELHDNVQQILAGTLLGIDYVIKKYDDAEAALGTLDDIKGYINDAINEVRKLSHTLAPSINEMESIEEKINTLVKSMNLRGKMKISYNIAENAQYLRMEKQLAIYRILQEQFTNILKYANADTVVISIYKEGDILIMSVKDDGVGFDTSIKTEGIGFENIKRRLSVLGGSLQIIAAKGKGCELIAHIPCA